MFKAVAAVVLASLTAPLYPGSSTPHAPTPSRRRLPKVHSPKRTETRKTQNQVPWNADATSLSPPGSKSSPSCCLTQPQPLRRASANGRSVPAPSRPHRGARQPPGSVGQGPAPRRGVRGLGSVGKLQRAAKAA